MTPLRFFVAGFVFTSVLSGCTVNVVYPQPRAAVAPPVRGGVNPCGMVNCNRPDTRRIV